ncbi:TIGR00180 family glycosyltransferase [Thermodesulfobacteriota bacterium]
MSQELYKQLTYLIPTRNRPQFLRRLFTFMDIMNERAAIQVIDSSQLEDQERNRILVEEFGKRLNLQYKFADLPMVTKCRQAVEQVTTPYLAFCADDDFLLPDAVYSCVDFLSHKPDYSCAQGIMVSLITDQQNRCTKLRGYSLEDDSPIRRFQRLAANWYTVFHSVYRTPTIVKAFQVTDDTCDDIRARIFPEFMLSQMSVILGKVKFFPYLYILREEHASNESVVTPNVHDQENIRELYNDFRDCLAQQLADASKITIDVTTPVVDKYFGYLRDGGKVLATKKKTLWFRLRRETIRLAQQFHDLLHRDAILQRRRLNLTSPICRNEAWQTAHQLMVKYPHGINNDKTI